MFRARSHVVAVLLCAAGLTACGGGLSDNEKFAAENISASLENEYGEITVADADCVAEKVVESVGLSHLKKAKVLGAKLTVLSNVRDATLTEADAKKVADGFEACLDLGDLVNGMVVDLFKPTPDQKECITDKVTDKAAAAWVTSDLSGKVTNNIYIVGGRDCMSSPEDDAEAVKRLSDSLAHGKGLDQEAAGCVAEGLVDQIGTYELIAAGVLNENLKIPSAISGTPLNATDAEIAATVTADCVSIDDLLSQPVKNADPASLELVKTCLGGIFDADSYHAYLASSYRGNVELSDEDTKKLADCLRPALEKIKQQAPTPKE